MKTVNVNKDAERLAFAQEAYNYFMTSDRLIVSYTRDGDLNPGDMLAIRNACDWDGSGYRGTNVIVLIIGDEEPLLYPSSTTRCWQ